MFRLIAVVLSVLCFASAAPENNSDRIVNGRSANIMEYAYQVSIQIRGSHFCGGSILGTRWILTAAHCLAQPIANNEIAQITVVAGTTNWNAGGVVKKAKWLKNHPLYDSKSMKYDVAVIGLDSDFMYSTKIKPVTICSNIIPDNRLVDVSGWGMMGENHKNLPTHLQAVTLRFLQKPACGSLEFRYGPSIMESMVCAYGPGQDSCQGDSGGPLCLSGEMNQIGVVSWGAGCAQPGLPGVYCDLTDAVVRQFIKSSCPAVTFGFC
ncbi:trypsin alpha-3-like [Episyrphus balteatus]|uniref:trypsin alpha-3-like n=1 Tax=Episyrphus balteatus TaxID=286459 RepID=UPI002486C0D9|nr:trypsin alpha-3-like [Episyrphus balteatus]